MKKYLMTGIAALAIGAAFVSCSKEVEQLSQEELDQIEVQKIKVNYEQAFIRTFGQPASNQDWGFGTGTRTAFTRTADPGDGGAYFGPEQGATYKAMGIVAPDMVSADEEKFVSDWFKTNKNPQSDEIDLSTFFVQQVYFGVKEYTGKDGNGAEHKVIGGQHMDWLCAGSDEMGDDHINNFNTSAPERYYVEGGWTNAREYQSKIMLMVNSSTKRFGCKESQGTDNTVYHNFVLKKLTFNGKVGYYVGFDYENHGQNGDFPKDGYYDDRIIKIVPGNGKYGDDADLRIIAEDLSAGEVDDDFDFNDVVIDVYYGNAGQAKAKILAAGGTLQLRVDGKEVHDEFSRANNNIDCAGKMINTNGTNSADANVRSKSLDGLTAPEITLSNEVKTPIQARDNIKIEVFKNNQWIELEAVIGKVASKVRVGTDYTWKDERQYVGDSFKAFVSGNASYDEWYQNQ